MIGEPIHILAKPGEVAGKVVVAGDPARIDYIARMLEEARLISSNRGLNTYTGRYKDALITVSCHGIGGPSTAIVFEELTMLGAKTIIRLGTAGSLIEDINPGDIVIPNIACYYKGAGTLSAYMPGLAPPAAPSYEVLEMLVNEARKSLKKFTVSPVVSSDAFYAEDEEFISRWVKVGAVAVEMECATIFALGYLRRVKTGAILIVTDNLVNKSRVREKEKINEWVQQAAKIVFESLRKIET
ncbi:MAG: purine-nucleoside phosphorylase [Nitrososphaerota archaeon]